MVARTLTDKQRTSMEALQAARAAGVGLSAYARAQGLNARQVHDSVAALRRRGVLPPTERPRPRKRRFVAVRVAESVVQVTPPTARALSRPLLVRLELRGGRLAQVEVADISQLVEVLRALDHAA
jgi:hypothetical protein